MVILIFFGRGVSKGGLLVLFRNDLVLSMTSEAAWEVSGPGFHVESAGRVDRIVQFRFVLRLDFDFDEIFETF